MNTLLRYSGGPSAPASNRERVKDASMARAPRDGPRPRRAPGGRHISRLSRQMRGAAATAASAQPPAGAPKRTRIGRGERGHDLSSMLASSDEMLRRRQSAPSSRARRQTSACFAPDDRPGRRRRVHAANGRSAKGTRVARGGRAHDESSMVLRSDELLPQPMKLCPRAHKRRQTWCVRPWNFRYRAP